VDTDLGRPIHFVPNAVFEFCDAKERVQAMMPDDEPPDDEVNKVRSHGLTPYMAALFRRPLLSPRLEVYLFHKMNFEKFLAECLRKWLLRMKPSSNQVRQMESGLANARLIRDQIVEANLRLLVSIAKRVVDQNNSLDELIAEGHLPLLRSAELFDVSRGFKFSTYASNAIYHHLNRVRANARKHRGRFVTVDSAILDEIPGRGDDRDANPERFLQQRAAVSSLMECLDERERAIVGSRFGLAGCESPESFARIGRQIGLSKERVRQISIRAMQKLESVAAGNCVTNV